jgi:hypothetical protein
MESSKISVKNLLIILSAGFVLFMSTRPALAHSSGPNLIHTESVGQITIPQSGITFGPAVPGCDAAMGGPACLFLNLAGTIAGRNTVLGPFKSTITATLLLPASTFSGSNTNGVPDPSFCTPELGSQVDKFADGSTLSSNFQGLSCCTAATCPFGPPSVNHDSSVITGGTGRLKGAAGGTSWSDNQGSTSGPLLMHAEGVLSLPQD